MSEIREAGVADVLRARDERAQRQRTLLARHGAALVSFTMNIAGPVKTDGLIRRAFFEGVARIENILQARRVNILEEIQTLAFTGDEKLWAVNAPAADLKRWMRSIEEQHPLGRLFDIDVLDEAGNKLARSDFRRCLICGGEVHACARSRAHTARELYLRAREMIQAHFDEEYARNIGMYAERALLFEAITTPKPGLVDRENNGAHRDMDLFSFAASAAALRDWFVESACIGAKMREMDEEEIFACLRAEGIRAEYEMLRATGGVNTHKGALFSLGILCCAAGMAGEGAKPSELFERAARIARCSLRDFELLDGKDVHTGGEAQYLQGGRLGIRGEAAEGFPSVRNIALPALRSAMNEGKSLNDSGLAALVALMSRVDDSNILRRRGEETLKKVQACANKMQDKGFSHDVLRDVNADFVCENISPGGSADLLAAAYFVYLLENPTGGNQL